MAQSSRGNGSGRNLDGTALELLSLRYGVCQKGTIGVGSTSVVRLVRKSDGSADDRVYAVKQFRRRNYHETQKDYVKRLTAEFCVSSTLEHANIMQTVDLVQDDHGRWCQVMEFCSGGDLSAAINKGKLSCARIQYWFNQVLQGVGYLHSQGVAHRDIKPENIYFDAAGHVKSTSGPAESYITTSARRSCPGALPSHPTLCSRRTPPLPPPPPAPPLTTKRHNRKLFPPLIKRLSPRACRPAIRRMLEPQPHLRATVEDVLGSPWVVGIGVERVEPVHEAPESRYSSWVRAEDSVVLRARYEQYLRFR
ncbi:Serine/threonine-protein kinase hal4 [Mycena kentingensis (nom. inval.)]|nr:Serine/threonine-protein kinase hal4 [Mycena kentingensis (nom. inval.)]